jgi:hypothetical protein
MNELPQSDCQFQLSSQAYWPKDLALVVHSELLRRGSFPPPPEVLVELFESMYFASLKTEESQPVLFHVAYVDSLSPIQSHLIESCMTDGAACHSLRPCHSAVQVLQKLRKLLTREPPRLPFAKIRWVACYLGPD